MESKIRFFMQGKDYVGARVEADKFEVITTFGDVAGIQ